MEFKLSLAFATPYYNWISVPYHRSMLGIANTFRPMGIKTSLFGIDRTNSVQARNNLMKRFMEKNQTEKFDWIFHIDSDMVFTPSHVISLIRDAVKYNLPLLSGVYFQRREIGDKRHPVALRRRNEDSYDCLEGLPESGLIEVDSVGQGFVVCKPEVYEKLQEKHGNHVFEYVSTKAGMKSEDIVWCERLKALGFKIMVDCDVRVGHYGVI